MSTSAMICEQCGGPLEDPNFAPLCFSCIEAEIAGRDPADAAQLAEDHARRALMDELGMPPDAAWKRITHPGALYGNVWQDYSIEMFGMSVSLLPRPCPWPYWYLSAPDGHGGIVVQLWLRRVRCNDTPVYVEARWHPERGQSIDLRGLEHIRHPREAQRGLKGLALLRHVERRGRPRGTLSYPDRDDFVARLERATHQIERRGERVTKRALAVELAVDRRTLPTLLQRHHVVVRQGRISSKHESR